MYKQYTHTFLISILFTTATFAKDITCEKKVISENRIDVKLNDRNLTLIGWEHRGLRAVQMLITDLTSLYGFVEGKQCSKVIELVESMRVRNAYDIASSKKIYSVLMQASEQNQIEFIGTEQTEENEKIESNNVMQFYVIFELLKENCPDVNKSVIEDLEYFAFGPDKMFALSKPQVFFLGVEDAVENKTAQDLMIKSNSLIDQITWRLSPKSQEFQQKILADVKIGKVPKQVDIESVIAGETDSYKASLLRKALESVKALTVHARVRNKKIAENLMERTENGAVLIGINHIYDLSNQLVQLCYKGSIEYSIK